MLSLPLGSDEMPRLGSVGIAAFVTEWQCQSIERGFARSLIIDLQQPQRCEIVAMIPNRPYVEWHPYVEWFEWLYHRVEWGM